MKLRFLAVLLVALAGTSPALHAQTTPPELQGGLEIKWIRDSEEYATLTRQVYRMAERAVSDAARRAQRGRWAVSLDLDETVLDNSAYQIERLAYRLPFDSASWNAWTRRRESGIVPGVVEFIRAVRALGGRIAWISNRWDTTREPTVADLARHGLWSNDDRICLLTAEPEYTKGARRRELQAGTGRCAWEGQPMAVLAFVGDAMGDFPAAGESDPDAGNDAAFGTRFFMLPNPMYGGWTTRVTRRDR
jgi:5'-nucleotidase (lipoprotein e(P4) family)